MQLSMFLPLQPRFVSSSSVTLILTVFLFISSIPHFAHATDAYSIAHDDHNHPRIRDLDDQSGVSGTLELMLEEGSRSYEPTFAGLERSILGRNLDIKPLKINNTSTPVDIDGVETHFWKVQSAPNARNLADAYGERNNGDFHELLKREDGWWMDLTLSICDIVNSGNDRPQMRLDIESPGSSGSFTTKLGFGSTYLKVSSDVHFNVSVNTSNSPDFEGTYTYELTASTVPYVNLTFLDSDNNSTLLAANLSSLSHDISHSIIVYPNNPSIQDISNSACALKKKLTPVKEANVTTLNQSLTGGIAKQLFHVNGLNPGTSYWAIIENSSQVVASSGFEVFRPVNFTTKSDGNCAVIYNLSFCTDTAYAVPYNPYSNLSLSALPDFYDSQAKLLYKNFTFSLEQIPCDTSSSAKYSLARSCNDCDKAYKSWLCAVTIPRCEDFSAEHDWLQNRSVSQPFWNNTNPTGISNSNKTRQVTNSSRQSMIDQTIKPGPWKEVLPCEDLCYQLVQSCPASLNFACPTGKWLGWNYGTAQKRADITCNDPRSEWNQSAASRGVSTNILGALVAFGLILVLQLGGHY